MSEKKKIQDYYFRVESDNERRVIGALLSLKFEISNNISEKGNNGYPFVYVAGATAFVAMEFDEAGRRKLATIDQLVKWACNGFDMREPWEVPEEGFRIVTDQERSENEYPLDCEVRWHLDALKLWKGSYYDIGWLLSEDQGNCIAFAVPTDYQFGPKEVSVDQIMELCGGMLKEKFGDNFVVKGVE